MNTEKKRPPFAARRLSPVSERLVVYLLNEADRKEREIGRIKTELETAYATVQTVLDRNEELRAELATTTAKLRVYEDHES